MSVFFDMWFYILSLFSIKSLTVSALIILNFLFGNSINYVTFVSEFDGFSLHFSCLLLYITEK